MRPDRNEASAEAQFWLDLQSQHDIHDIGVAEREKGARSLPSARETDGCGANCSPSAA